MWQLTLFGGFALEGATSLTGRASQRKRQALLALLGSGPHPQISRDKVVALLWPESDVERARHLLASSIYDLRQVLGDDAILATGEDLRLNPERVRSDVREFDAAIERRDFAAAASLRSGAFLDGFHVNDAPEFERWVDGERDRLDQLHAHAIEQLARQCSSSGDHSAAARWLQQLVTQQPYNSRLALLYMQALDKSGDAAGAIRYARTHELLTQEFGVATDEQIAAFVAELRARPAASERVVAALPRAATDNGDIVVGVPRAPTPRLTRKRWWLPVGVLAMAAIIVVLFAMKGSARVRDRSIAVLPFKSLSASEENAYFADGVHEDLITHLAQFPDLIVISRTSVMQYRNADVSVRDIGRALDVAVVLEGSVRRAGNRVRVVAQLIDAQTDKHLWADTYDREVTDVFAIQSEIAAEIARVLHTDLGAQPASIGAPPTTVTEAYDLYLRARGQVYATAVQSIDYPEVLRLLSRAIELDPNFALAYAELTRTHAGMYWTGMDASNTRAAAAASALAKAERLRPGAVETRIAAAYYQYWVRRDFRRALAELEQARAQLPGSAEVLHLIGIIQRRIGLLDSAIVSFTLAAQRDPARPLPFTYLGESLAGLGRFAEANRAYQNALARSPTDPYTLRTYGEMHVAWRGATDTLRAVVSRIAPSARSMGGVPAARFRIAMLERDCAAAAAAVRDAPEVIGLQNAVRPRALYQAWAAQCSGNEASARTYFRQAEHIIRDQIAREGAHPAWHMWLAHTMVGTGRTEEGLAEAQRAFDGWAKRDVQWTRIASVELAGLYTRAKHYDQALRLLEQSCGPPFGIWPNELRLDPRWDALRALPRFQALVRSSCR